MQSLLHTGGITIGGLSKLLTTLRRHGLPDATSTHYTRTANVELFFSLRRVIPMPLANEAGTYEWDLVDPNLLLAVALEKCQPLNKLFAEAIARKPPTSDDPWRLVIGFDAFMPGSTDLVAKLNYESGFHQRGVAVSFLMLSLDWGQCLIRKQTQRRPLPGHHGVVVHFLGARAASLVRRHGLADASLRTIESLQNGRASVFSHCCS